MQTFYSHMKTDSGDSSGVPNEVPNENLREADECGTLMQLSP